jgi:hypothetical protein
MPLERAVEHLARIVAGERTPRAVGAFEPGREADDQKSRIQRAEARHRRIEEIGKDLAVRMAEFEQSRT